MAEVGRSGKPRPSSSKGALTPTISGEKEEIMEMLIIMLDIKAIICNIVVSTVNIMKKLIVLQNDYPATGKSTLARCFSRFLHQYGVSHHFASLVEDAEGAENDQILDSSFLTPMAFMDMVEANDITI